MMYQFFNCSVIRRLINNEFSSINKNVVAHCKLWGYGQYYITLVDHDTNKTKSLIVKTIYDERSDFPYHCLIVGGAHCMSKDGYNLEELAFLILNHYDLI